MALPFFATWSSSIPKSPRTNLGLLSLLLAILNVSTSSFVAVLNNNNPIAISSRISRPTTHHLQQQQQQHPSKSVLRLHAKKQTKKKKKAAVASAAGGIKGFGAAAAVVTNTKSSSGAAAAAAAAAVTRLDTSRETRAFYDQFLTNRRNSALDASDNWKRTALGYTTTAVSTGGGDFELRGVIATRDIPKGGDLINIPYERAMNLGPEGDDPTLPAVDFLKDYCAVMLNENNDNNDKIHYYRMLPPFQEKGGGDCWGSTDFFSPAALRALQSPLIAEETERRRAATERRFASAVVAESSNPHPTWIDGTTPLTAQHLQWAVWLITSRVLTVQGDAATGASHRLLIPYLDMCNHDRRSPHVLTGRAVPGGRLRVVAGENVRAGDSVDICYGGGVAGNDRFVQDYGFLDSNGEAYDLVAQELLGRRRIREGHNVGKTVSEADRERSLQALRATTVKQDQAALEQETDPQMRTAIEYRLGLKKALSKYIVIS